LAPVEILVLLVCHSNFGAILQHFRDTAEFMSSWLHPYSTLIFGVFPSDQIAHVGVSRRRSYSAVKLFYEYSNLCEKHTSTSRRDRQRDGPTNRQLCSITALCLASRGKKVAHSKM